MLLELVTQQTFAAELDRSRYRTLTDHRDVGGEIDGVADPIGLALGDVDVFDELFHIALEALAQLLELGDRVVVLGR